MDIQELVVKAKRAISGGAGSPGSHDGVSGVTSDQHHPQSHTIESHSDTTATGGQLNTLVGGGETSLHSHAGTDGQAFPMGAVFLSVVSTNPNTLLGYGTWTQIDGGRFLVGQTGGDADFDTPEQTGGAKLHQHDSHGTNGARSGSNLQAFTSPGQHDAKSNLPPYIVVYIWKRTG